MSVRDKEGAKEVVERVIAPPDTRDSRKENADKVEEEIREDTKKV